MESGEARDGVVRGDKLGEASPVPALRKSKLLSMLKNVVNKNKDVMQLRRSMLKD